MSGSPIDRIISALHRDGGSEVLFRTGDAVKMRVGDTMRVIIAQKVGTAQIEGLLADAVPVDRRADFRRHGQISFEYQSPSGPVSVEVERGTSGLRVRVAPPGRGRAPQVQPMGMTIESPLDAISPPMLTASDVRPIEEEPRRSFPPPAPPSAPASPMAPPPREVAAERPLYVPPGARGPAMPQTQAVPSAPSPAAAPAYGAASGPAPTAPLVRARPQAAPGKARIDPILRTLVEQGGSDLHLTAGLRPLMRKDGSICEIPGFDQALSSNIIEEWLLEVAPEKSQIQFGESSDADCGYEIPSVARFRVNIFRDRRGVGGCLRVIPSKVATADDLGLPPVIRNLCSLEKGLVVVTGPTGSGKSTTLAAMIDLINKTRTDHIITIEDPVEFVHEPIRCLLHQREVHSHTKSFSAALRAALREDPDIVLVGEMRDLETVSIAIETAETGHLVFGTLHTNTAISTVDRIIDQFPTDQQAQIRIMLSESLKGVVAQTLCKRIGGGRVAALEILLVVPAVSNLIREGKTFQILSVMQTGRNLGMQTLNEALLNLVQQRKIDANEAYKKSVARTEMLAALQKAGYQVT